MNHSFNPSQIDATKCQVCKWPEIQHTENAVCDACPNVGKVEPSISNKMLLCPDCWNKEAQIPINDVLVEAKKVDDSINLRTDLFNAATKSIMDIKQAIDEDETIENKNYKLAEILRDRFSHFKNVVFEAQQTIVDASNNQKAIQVYLNNLANQLRADEREKLKLHDINYKPATVKPARVTTLKPKVKKLDKVELRKVAGEFNIPEFFLQQVVVQANMTPREAAEKIMNDMAKMKAQNTTVEAN
jgi:hypothetical protein